MDSDSILNIVAHIGDIVEEYNLSVDEVYVALLDLKELGITFSYHTYFSARDANFLYEYILSGKSEELKEIITNFLGRTQGIYSENSSLFQVAQFALDMTPNGDTELLEKTISFLKYLNEAYGIMQICNADVGPFYGKYYLVIKNEELARQIIAKAYQSGLNLSSINEVMYNACGLIEQIIQEQIELTEISSLFSYLEIFTGLGFTVPLISTLTLKYFYNYNHLRAMSIFMRQISQRIEEPWAEKYLTKLKSTKFSNLFNKFGYLDYIFSEDVKDSLYIPMLEKFFDILRKYPFISGETDLEPEEILTSAVKSSYANWIMPNQEQQSHEAMASVYMIVNRYLDIFDYFVEQIIEKRLEKPITLKDINSTIKNRMSAEKGPIKNTNVDIHEQKKTQGIIDAFIEFEVLNQAKQYMINDVYSILQRDWKYVDNLAENLQKLMSIYKLLTSEFDVHISIVQFSDFVDKVSELNINIQVDEKINQLFSIFCVFPNRFGDIIEEIDNAAKPTEVLNYYHYYAKKIYEIFVNCSVPFEISYHLDSIDSLKEIVDRYSDFVREYGEEAFKELSTSFRMHIKPLVVDRFVGDSANLNPLKYLDHILVLHKIKIDDAREVYKIFGEYTPHKNGLEPSSQAMMLEYTFLKGFLSIIPSLIPIFKSEDLTDEKITNLAQNYLRLYYILKEDLASARESTEPNIRQYMPENNTIEELVEKLRQIMNSYDELRDIIEKSGLNNATFKTSLKTIELYRQIATEGNIYLLHLKILLVNFLRFSINLFDPCPDEILRSLLFAIQKFSTKDKLLQTLNQYLNDQILNNSIRKVQGTNSQVVTLLHFVAGYYDFEVIDSNFFNDQLKPVLDIIFYSFEDWNYDSAVKFIIEDYTLKSMVITKKLFDFYNKLISNLSPKNKPKIDWFSVISAICDLVKEEDIKPDEIEQYISDNLTPIFTSAITHSDDIDTTRLSEIIQQSSQKTYPDILRHIMRLLQHPEFRATIRNKQFIDYRFTTVPIAVIDSALEEYSIQLSRDLEIKFNISGGRILFKLVNISDIIQSIALYPRVFFNPTILLSSPSKLTEVDYSDLHMQAKFFVWVYQISKAYEMSRSIESKAIADRRNRTLVSNADDQYPLKYWGADILVHGCPYFNRYNENTLNSLFSTGIVPLGGGDTPSDGDVHLGVIKNIHDTRFSKLVEATMSIGYGEGGKLGSDGQLLILLGSKEFNADGKLYDVPLGEVSHNKHFVAFGGIPSTEIRGIVFMGNKDTQLVETSMYTVYEGITYEDSGNKLLEKIKHDIALNGFYIPVFDKEGNLIFDPVEYDHIREIHGYDYVQYEKIANYSAIADQKGSNNGETVSIYSEDGEDEIAYLKYARCEKGIDTPEAQHKIAVELVMDEILRTMGLCIPSTSLVWVDDKNIFAKKSTFVQGAAGDQRSYESFALAAMLTGNHDAFINDQNYRIAEDGKIYLLDNGNNFIYYSSGTGRYDNPNSVSEMYAKYRGNIDKISRSELENQFKMIEGLTKKTIVQILENSIVPIDLGKHLLESILSRRNELLEMKSVFLGDIEP